MPFDFSEPDPQRVEFFSCPEPDPEGRINLLHEIQRSQAIELTQGFVSRYGETLKDRDDGLFAVLEAVRAGGISAEQAIAYPIPQYRFLFGSEELDPLIVATQTALHLGVHGQAQEWKVEFPEPAVFVGGNRYKADLLSMEQSGNQITGTTAQGDLLALEEWDELPSVDNIGFLTSIPKQAFLKVLNNQEESPQLKAEECKIVLSEALDIIEQFTPAYLPWVKDILRWLVPIYPPEASTGATSRAFSMYGVPSIVHMSFPNNPLKIADLLVHECSHQYYHVAEDWFRLSNDQDKELYYSDYVKKDRPIDRILIAFHAFANVSRFYIECLRNDAPFKEKAMQELGRHERWLSDFKEHLHATPGLTKAGHNVWRPLSKLLFV